jgi:hypothetical protein
MQLSKKNMPRLKWDRFGAFWWTVVAEKLVGSRARDFGDNSEN